MDGFTLAASKPRIGIVGGTGKEGSALALRFGSRGYEIYLGSRDVVKAEKKASQLNERMLEAGEAASITGVDDHTAIREGDVVFLSIPYSIESKVGATIPIKNILLEEREFLRDKLLVDVIVPTKVHAPMVIDEEDLLYYRRKFGVGKTPSVTEEIYLFAYNHLNLTLRIVGAFKTISFHRIADVRKDLLDEILIWGFEEPDIHAVRRLCEDVNKAEKPRIYEVPQIFWRSIEGVCEYIREQSLMGKRIMALTFSYEMKEP
jgi:NADPH-dependent F420 reductase